MNPKINDCYDFILFKKDDFYFQKFRVHLNEILWFVQSSKIQPSDNVSPQNFIKLLEIRADYFRLLYEIFSDLLGIYPKILDVNFTLYPDLRKHFQLEDIPVYSVRKGEDITTWSHPYWNFLHWTSICVYIKFRNDPRNHPKIVDKFGAMLINLDFILLCGSCVENYKNLNKQKLIGTMRDTHDSITAIYDLHNMVTNNVNPRAAGRFSFETFESTYELKRIPSNQKRVEHKPRLKPYSKPIAQAQKNIDTLQKDNSAQNIFEIMDKPLMQIETITVDGKRRITPAFMPITITEPNLDVHSSSSNAKSQIIIEKKVESELEKKAELELEKKAESQEAQASLDELLMKMNENKQNWIQ